MFHLIKKVAEAKQLKVNKVALEDTWRILALKDEGKQLQLIITVYELLVIMLLYMTNTAELMIHESLKFCI